MKVQVTKKHIEQGVAEDCENCPIAKALKFKLHHRVSVGDSTVEVTKRTRTGTTTVCYALPKNAQDFVNKFDQGQAVKPISFELKRLD